MAVTLEDIRVGLADHVAQELIDEFRRSSLIMDQLIFDDTVSPRTGGSTLVYGYKQLKSPSTAAFRDLNSNIPRMRLKLQRKLSNLRHSAVRRRLTEFFSKLQLRMKLNFSLNRRYLEHEIYFITML